MYKKKYNKFCFKNNIYLIKVIVRHTGSKYSKFKKNYQFRMLGSCRYRNETKYFFHSSTHTLKHNKLYRFKKNIE